MKLNGHHNKANSEACPVDNAEFNVRGTSPLLPVNPIWKREERKNSLDVGILLEVQTIACKPDLFALGKNWWPLTSAHISRSLNVRNRILSSQS